MKQFAFLLVSTVIGGCGERLAAPRQTSEAASSDQAAVTRGTAESTRTDRSQLEMPDIDELIRQLADKDPGTRTDAAEQLGALGLPAKDAIPRLIERLEDEQPRVRGTAAMAIGQILAIDWNDSRPRDRGPHVDAAVAALMKSLEDTEPLVRQMAALSLGDIGPDATPAIPALTKLLDDDEATVHKAAETAIQLISGKFGGSLHE